MSQQIVIAYLVFMVAALFTPGPNNMMLLTSGLNFGFRRTVPHIFGVGFGFTLLLGLVGAGLGVIFKAYPLIFTVLKYAGAVYLVWLAIGIARSSPQLNGAPEGGRPLSFLGAALYQWVNVKSWVVAIGAMAAYSAIAPYPANVIVLSGLALVLGLASALTWAFFGAALRPLLASPRVVRVFNIVMALALIGSLYPVLWG